VLSKHLYVFADGTKVLKLRDHRTGKETVRKRLPAATDAGKFSGAGPEREGLPPQLNERGLMRWIELNFGLTPDEAAEVYARARAKSQAQGISIDAAIGQEIGRDDPLLDAQLGEPHP
jgi:hypothetical protein